MHDYEDGQHLSRDQVCNAGLLQLTENGDRANHKHAPPNLPHYPVSTLNQKPPLEA